MRHYGYILVILSLLGLLSEQTGAFPRPLTTSLLTQLIRPPFVHNNHHHNQPIFTAQEFDDSADSDYPMNSDGHGFKSEFVMGRDKELLHAAIDLGWLYNSIINKRTWQALFSRLWQRICRISGNYNKKVLYREGLLRIAAQLRLLNPQCNLRFLQCSLLESQHLAIRNKKFIVYYMEEHVANELTPSLETVLFRNALTQNGIIASEGLSNEIEFGALCRFNLTEILNSKFLLMASDHEHPYAQYIQSLIASYYSSIMEDRSHPGHAQAAFAMAVSEMQFPLMVVVAPPAADFEEYFNYVLACNKHAEKVDQIQKDLTDPYLRKKLLKELKLPQYYPKKKLNLEVLGVMRLNTDLILESIYDRKSPDTKTYDVSELVIRFLEKVKLEHKDRLEDLHIAKDEIQTLSLQQSQERQEEDEEPSCGDVIPNNELDNTVLLEPSGSRKVFRLWTAIMLYGYFITLHSVRPWSSTVTVEPQTTEDTD